LLGFLQTREQRNIPIHGFTFGRTLGKTQHQASSVIDSGDAAAGIYRQHSRRTRFHQRTGFLFGVPVPVYLMAAVLVTATVFLRSTNVGQEIYAIGANPEAARLSGVPVRRRQMLVYMLSGLMSGLAAVVFLARVNAADSGMGEPLLLPVIAAVLIGGTSLFGGVGSVLGTVLGAIILALVINGMNLLDIRAQWQPLVVGVVLLAAVMVDLVGRGRRERIG